MMSIHKALKEIMKMSDAEIKEMFQEIRFEKAMAAELAATANIIKKTGMFDNVDRIYGDYDAMNGDQSQQQHGGGEENEPYIVEEAGYAEVESDEINGKIKGHEYVDLGLPSGLKWATCNVGAESPEDFGDYFAWGEIKTKKDYSWDTYMYGYVVSDNKTRLDPKNDVAIVKWNRFGRTWRMPTNEEWRELSIVCTWVWTTQKSVQGYKIIGPSGGSIFLPATGMKVGKNIYAKGRYCYYWSSSCFKEVFNSDLPYLYYSGERCNGHTVRPVCK
jgi:hypothetical protein